MNAFRSALFVALLMVACGNDETDVTPTQAPPSDAPGLEKTVGAVFVAYVQGYDLATGQPGGTDFSSTVLGAGFVDPSAEEVDASPSTLPEGTSVLSDGFATDSCMTVDLTALVEAGGAVAPSQALKIGVDLALSETDEGGTLVSVGAEVDVTIGENSISIPLVDEENLPAPLEDAGLSPLYFVGEEGLVGDLYDPAQSYGVSAPGGDNFPGFEAAPFFQPPTDLLLQSPDVILTGGAVQRDEDLIFEWAEGDGNFVVIDLHLLTGEGLSCVVVDDGAFSIPASQLETLPAGDALLTQARFTTADTEIRINERIMGVGAVSVTAQVTMN